MPQLRTFSAYTKNANAGVSLITRQCALSNIDGNYITGAAGQYFQLHDKATAPVNADVPVKSFYLASAGPINLMSIFQVLGPINFVNGLGVAISSTEATLTLGTGSFDVFGEIEEYELPVSGLTTAASGASGVDYVVWAQNAVNILYELTIVNNEGITIYPMIFRTTASPGEGSVSGLVEALTPPVTTGTTKKYSFGSAGFMIPAVLSGGITFTGCHIMLSASGSAYSSVGIVADAGTSITAKYKNV